MAKPTEKAVETWNLSKMLAVLCQFAQEACDVEGAPEPDQRLRFAPELSVTNREGSRP